MRGRLRAGPSASEHDDDDEGAGDARLRVAGSMKTADMMMVVMWSGERENCLVKSRTDYVEVVKNAVSIRGIL